MDRLTTDILVVGGGTGATAAAIQAARSGIRQGTQVILVSDHSWLGGMLTSAGVSAPDGNELLAFQTGLWGQFLQALQHRQPNGVDHAWVSCFTYDPRIGAQIFAEWVQNLPNLRWIHHQSPREVHRQGQRVAGVVFDSIAISASVILDGTELGDVLALGDVPHRWGWDMGTDSFGEPSAPSEPNRLTQTYPVQLPTWVVVMQDFGEEGTAPVIPPTPLGNDPDFNGVWENYGPTRFLDYGRLPGDRVMINWPQQGNDYGHDLDRLVATPQARHEWLQEARWHTQQFARYLQQHLGQRYGLAMEIFPSVPHGLDASHGLGGGAYALHPYYRESRRLKGVVTVREQDILPQAGTDRAPLPWNDAGEMEAIAIGNYANDHHYPAPESQLLTLTPKSMRWGGRWTGTPFTLPYRCLIPEHIDGLLVCEKNISVSHIANGATRLQPIVMNLGQAAGMAAALCIEHQCQPRDLSVRTVQEGLLTDSVAPAAVIPLLNLPPHHLDWLRWQRYYLEAGDLPANGQVPDLKRTSQQGAFIAAPYQDIDYQTIHSQTINDQTINDQAIDDRCICWTGIFQRSHPQCYHLLPPDSPTVEQSWPSKRASLPLITLDPDVNLMFELYAHDQPITVKGYWNAGGPWLRVTAVVTHSLSQSCDAQRGGDRQA